MKYDTTLQRDKDFIAAFLSVVQRYPSIANEEAIRIAIHSQAPRFYISLRQALLYCNRLNARAPINIQPHTEKYLCITTIYAFARLYAIRNNTSFSAAVEAVIEQPAPRFYINRSTAYSIIQNRNKHHKH